MLQWSQHSVFLHINPSWLLSSSFNAWFVKILCDINNLIVSILIITMTIYAGINPDFSLQLGKGSLIKNVNVMEFSIQRGGRGVSVILYIDF